MNLVLTLIWLGLLVEILILSFLKPFIIDFELASVLAVFLHVLYTMIILIAYKDKHKIIFFWAFIVRFLFMLWDIYARHIFSLPNSGYDSNAFYRSAIAISENMSLLNGAIRGGLFAKINGVIFNLIGPQQMFGHYINVLLGLMVVFIIYKILLMLELEPKLIRTIILVAAFFPNTLVMSAIFLREMVVTFFVTWSLYFFIKWFKDDLNSSMVFSIVILGLASMFHSGVSSIYYGYAIFFIFYNQKEKRLRIHSQTLQRSFIILAFAFFAIVVFGDIILGEFQNPDGTIDVYETADYIRGESAYLTGISINNPIQFIVYSPIKAFYFLTSPLPLNWRGPMDIFTFLYDSSLYLVTIFYFIKNRKKLGHKKVLAVGLLLIIISASLVFGIGVSNAGTAIRHRHKIMPIFLILLAVMIEGKSLFNSKIDLLKRQGPRVFAVNTEYNNAANQ